MAVVLYGVSRSSGLAFNDFPRKCTWPGRRIKSKMNKNSSFLDIELVSGVAAKRGDSAGVYHIRKIWPSQLLRGSRPVLSCEKWKSQLLTLSHQNFMTDRPVSESESNFVRPNFGNGRSVGRKVFTLTPTRPFSHERTGREPRSIIPLLDLFRVFQCKSRPRVSGGLRS